jgi:hypothetical protein
LRQIIEIDGAARLLRVARRAKSHNKYRGETNCDQAKEAVLALLDPNTR